MLSTLPDILNEYRDSLTRNNMPGSFTYFAFDKYPVNATHSKLELPKYNIWTTPVLHPDYLNSLIYSDNSPYDVYDTGSSKNLTSGTSSDYSSSPKTDAESSPESSSISSSDYDNDSSPSPSSNDSSYDSGSDTMLPSMELIVPYKRLDLAPSCFLNGCVCGHHFEFRDMAYESRRRRNPRSNGVTIRPKTPPISAKLRCCAG